MADIDYYKHHLEWEVIDSTVEIKQLRSQGDLYSFDSTNTITVCRDKNYKLTGTLKGEMNEGNLDLMFPQLREGEMTSGEMVIGVSDDDRQYVLTGVIITNFSLNHDFNNPGQGSFTATVQLDSLTICNDCDTEANKIQYWYLCAKSNVGFPMQTQRTSIDQYPKQRMQVDELCPLEKSFVPGGKLGFTNDFLPLNINEKLVILSDVPKSYLPANASGLCFECRSTFQGGIPDENEIKATAELLGFVIGSPLLLIGVSFYDNHRLLRQMSISPSVSNLPGTLRKNPSPPVPVQHYANMEYFLATLYELLPRYLEMRDVLKLNNALSSYWIAKDSPIGVNLPILSSALEAIANASLKDPANITQQSNLIPSDEWRSLIKEEYESIKAKLEKAGVQYRDILTNKIDSAFNMGGNEKIKLLFERFGLTVDTIENEALKSRNKMAHGAMKVKNYKKYEEIIRHSVAYETLFHRIFLKILSYSGRYIDYYTYGYPLRAVDEPIPTEDKK